jgi:hypothetical protein
MCCMNCEVLSLYVVRDGATKVAMAGRYGGHSGCTGQLDRSHHKRHRGDGLDVRAHHTSAPNACIVNVSFILNVECGGDADDRTHTF